MNLNLSNHQPKIDCSIHSILCTNLMVIIGQKIITDTQKIKIKEYKHNTKQSHQITREGNKRKGKKKRKTIKTTRK